ncbi:MAG: peptide-methionine (R)-S-oxide reductase MsrB [Patescibacteria group bacterium]
MPDQMSDDDWKAKLTPEQYHVLREKGTEAPFSGKLLNNKGSGDYTCAACGAVVFRSGTKFDSGSGWPSFYDMAADNAVTLTDDNSLGMSRTEVTCTNCGSHLGHMFKDAVDQPTGMRFCINSTSLEFKDKNS